MPEPGHGLGGEGLLPDKSKGLPARDPPLALLDGSYGTGSFAGGLL